MKLELSGVKPTGDSRFRGARGAATLTKRNHLSQLSKFVEIYSL